jgi:hypothetical protein
MLETWSVKDIVKAFCFDTTANNSGIRNGCCALMEKELKRAVFGALAVNIRPNCA